MKYALFLCLTSQLLSIAVFGQMNRFDLGVMGGPSVTLIWGNSFVQKYGQPTVGFSTGISFRYNLPKYLSVGTDITFERKGNLTKSDATDSEGNFIGEIVERNRLDYISIPVLARFSIGNKVRFFFNLGPHFGYLTQATASWTAPPQFTPFLPVTDKTDNFKRFDIGLTTGLGLAVPIKDKFLVSAEFRNNLGLYNISSYPVIAGGSLKTNSTQLVIGIFYLLGKRTE